MGEMMKKIGGLGAIPASEQHLGIFMASVQEILGELATKIEKLEALEEARAKKENKKK